MTIKEINNKIIESLIPALLGATGATIIWLFSDIPSIVLSFLSSIPQNILSKITIGLCILSLALAVWIYLLRKKLKRIPAFGVLWDQKYNAYCPSCEKLLSNYNNRYRLNNIEGPGFLCIHCKTYVLLRKDSGFPIDLDEARYLLEQKRK
jgi:hypothetical protein